MRMRGRRIYGNKCLEQCHLCWMNMCDVHVHVSVVVNAIVTLILEYYSVWCNHDGIRMFHETDRITSCIYFHISICSCICIVLYCIVCSLLCIPKIIRLYISLHLLFIHFILTPWLIRLCKNEKKKKIKNITMKSKTEVIWYA